MNSGLYIRSGTLGGTLLTISINIRYEDIVKTIVLAGVGAVVSFAISMILGRMLKRWRK